MRIKQKSQSKRIVIISTILAAIIVTSGVVFVYLSQQKPIDSPVDRQSASDTNKPKEKTSPGTTLKDDIQVDNKKPRFIEQPTQNIENAHVGSISVNSNQTTVSASMSIQPVASGGQCVAYFTSEKGDNVSQNLETSTTESGVTCHGDIPVGQFSYLGIWTAKIVYIIDNKKVEGNTKFEVSA